MKCAVQFCETVLTRDVLVPGAAAARKRAGCFRLCRCRSASDYGSTAIVYGGSAAVYGSSAAVYGDSASVLWTHAAVHGGAAAGQMP
eukprot:744653-Rhodomonas_salina.6